MKPRECVFGKLTFGFISPTSLDSSLPIHCLHTPLPCTCPDGSQVESGHFPVGQQSALFVPWPYPQHCVSAAQHIAVNWVVQHTTELLQPITSALICNPLH